jgi:hypothetical protein
MSAWLHGAAALTLTVRLTNVQINQNGRPRRQTIQCIEAKDVLKQVSPAALHKV